MADPEPTRDAEIVAPEDRRQGLRALALVAVLAGSLLIYCVVLMITDAMARRDAAPAPEPASSSTLQSLE